MTTPAKSHKAKRPMSSVRLSAGAARKTCGRRGPSAEKINMKEMDAAATASLRKRGQYATSGRWRNPFGLGSFPFSSGGADACV